MGLSTPLALLAAALVALPVIAHLIRRADVERRVLPTVALLTRVLVRDRRRARVTEPWLLALRVAAVALAILALAGPFVVERLAYGDGSAIALAIVLDDSQSMAQRDEGGQRAFDRARARAEEIALALGPASEVVVVMAGAPARVLVPRTDDRELVTRALAGASLGARETDLSSALELASRQLASARLGTRRTIVLSDFAGVGASEALAHAGREIELAPTTVEAPVNVGIAEVRATRDPLDPAGWSLTVELASSGVPVEGAPSLVLAVVPIASGAGLPSRDAEELGRVLVELSAGRGRGTLRFRPPSGVDRVAVQLREARDALPEDDQRVVVLRPPAATRVVLVEPSGVHAARFAARALAALPEGASAFLVTTVDADHLAAGRSGTIDPAAPREQHDPLSGADVVVLAGVVPSSPAAIEALRRFVEGGGGLLVAPAPSTRAIDLAPIAELLPARAGEVEPVSGGAAPVAHGALALLPPGPTGLEALALTARLAVRTEPSRVALTFADGAPMLVLDLATRRALLTVGLDDAMSDLPLRVGFVPLVLSLADALARPGALPDHPFSAGAVPPLRVARDVTALEILAPSGEVLEREPTDGSVALDDLAQAGSYTLRVRDDAGLHELSRAALVIVPPASEIDLTPHVPERPDGEASERASEGETQSPVERWFFALVGLLAAIEGFARLRRPPLPRAAE